MTHQGKPYHATTLQHHARCPMSAHLSATTEITSMAMERGRVLHALVYMMLEAKGYLLDESAIQMTVNLLPPEVAQETMEIWRAIKAKPPEVPAFALMESPICVDKEWNQTSPTLDDAWIIGTPDVKWFIGQAEIPSLHILDHKSDAKPGGRGDPAMDDQLLCYAALGLSVYPDTRVFRLGYYYMRWGYTHWAEVDDLAVRGARKRLSALALDLEKCDRIKKWPARVHDKCSWCGFRGSCPPYQLAIERGFGKGMPRSEKGAAKLRRTADLMASEAARLKELASRYVEKHGPVKDGDQTLAHWPKEYKDYPLKETVDLLVQEKDLDPFTILEGIHPKGFKASNLKPWTAGGKKNPLNEALERIVKITPGSTFTWKKVKEGE